MLPEEYLQIIKDWLHSIFLEDWLTKAVALVISLVIWYGVTGNRTPTTVKLRNVPLSFRLPTETEISNEVIVDDVEVTVTGDKNRIDRLNPREMVVIVDLSNYKPGDFVVQLQPDTVNLDLPNGVRLDEIEPNKISVKLEQRIEKLIEVRPAFTGQLGEGHEIYDFVVSPSRVRVRGAESRLAALDRVPTQKIDLSSRTEDFVEKQITVDLLDTRLTVLDAVIDVAVNIGPHRVEKTLANVPVVAPEGARSLPETATVTLYGPGSVLDNLKSEQLQIVLEFAADGAVTPRVVLPPEISEQIQTRGVKPGGFTIVR